MNYNALQVQMNVNDTLKYFNIIIIIIIKVKNHHGNFYNNKYEIFKLIILF